MIIAMPEDRSAEEGWRAAVASQTGRRADNDEQYITIYS